MESSILDQFTKIKLQKLDVVCENALKEGKYCLILDQTGNCEIYFEYKATQR